MAAAAGGVMAALAEAPTAVFGPIIAFRVRILGCIVNSPNGVGVGAHRLSSLHVAPGPALAAIAVGTAAIATAAAPAANSGVR